MRYRDRLLFLNALSQPEVRKSLTLAFLPSKQGSRAWWLVRGLWWAKPGGRAGRAWLWAMLVGTGRRPTWSTPGSVCAGHRGALRLPRQGPRSCRGRGRRGLALAACAAATRPCRLLFARDGFSFKSCVPPPPAPLCTLLELGPAGLTFS